MRLSILNALKWHYVDQHVINHFHVAINALKYVLILIKIVPMSNAHKNVGERNFVGISAKKYVMDVYLIIYNFIT